MYTDLILYLYTNDSKHMTILSKIIPVQNQFQFAINMFAISNDFYQTTNELLTFELHPILTSP